MARSVRDPRRSLILGTVIAAVVLLLILVVVVIGLLKVFLPRSADPEGMRPPTTAIHRERSLDS